MFIQICNYWVKKSKIEPYWTNEKHKYLYLKGLYLVFQRKTVTLLPGILTTLLITMEIDDILFFNRLFVEKKGYEPYITDKFPKKHLAILTCMDTRLSVLLQEALGLKNGDAKIIKNAGAVIPSPYDSAMRSLVVAVYELGVTEVMVIAHSTCGACHMSYSHLKDAMLERGISVDTLNELISKEGIDLDQWLEGFHDTEKSVRDTVTTIKAHPLMPKDLIVRGFVMDSVTGGLTEVNCN